MSSTALAVSAEPIKEADPVTAMITAADTLPGISAYPAAVSYTHLTLPTT